MKQKKENDLLHEQYGLASDWYSTNETVRSSLEQEWRDSAQLTIPYIFPQDENTSEGSILPTPYNSIGTAAVNALSSKLLLALLPPTGGFFRLLPDRELVADMDTKTREQADSQLAQVERDVVEYINQKAMRVPVFEAIKLLAVTGNAMMYKIPNGSFKVFSPYQYTVERDYVGHILTACIKERMSWSSLPKKVQTQLSDESDDVTPENGHKESKEIHIYTMIVKEGDNKFKVFQEINGVIIDGTVKSYTEEKLPYIILRWTSINNESYGRGHVQQYLGDLRSLEGLSQTIVEGSGIAATTIFGVRPGATVKVEDLNNAENGSFVLGDLDREVTTLSTDKSADLSIAMQMMSQLEQRISQAFLMLGGQIRDSERTTATEVRATAAELESTLGGVFSVLAAEFQKPLITLILQELQPEVLKVSTPSVTTGIAAISREKDFNNLNTMLQSIAQLGPEVIAQYLDVPAYLGQIATSLGMEPDKIVKSPEQMQQEQQAQQQAMQQQQQQEVAGQMAVDNNKQGE